MTDPKTIKIGNYQALKLIHSSDRTLVYRAQNVENGQQFALKLMRNEYPSFRELVQFRNQYVISKNLEIEGIIKTHALERYENRYALIMEDMGGVSLAEYQPRVSLSVSEFLNIAIQLSEILHQLHNNWIIHKDIKPANILIHPETKQVKLIDFSISSLLPKETQAVETPNVLEGTLAYLSPEQTGRMNRGIDYRSDFYSVGVTFYELLMGTLPFSSDDALELIHAHIALSPKPLSELVVLGGDLCPLTLSDIVLKLMAKNGEDRYQSALGLKYDLEKCWSQYQQRQKIEPFELGERDLCDRFFIPEKLYGREKEVQTLLDAFERVASPPTPLGKGGRSEMMLVAGFSGIGKTAVVNEVHKPIVRQRGYLIKGKFDQFNRNIPFSAFVQAFRDLMGQLLGEGDAELQEWKAKIQEAVGENGQVLIDVIPELERIIGTQHPAPELSGSAAQNRFNLLFEKFIAVFTTIEHPLTIFVDDLQWADSASLNLLKILMGDTRTGYLLLLGAYRDNEVFPAHPLMLTLAELEKRCDPALAQNASDRTPRRQSQGNADQERERAPREQQTKISTITLAPLSVSHINQLVAETLSCTLELAAPLTDLVYQKTRGNPFFSTQFLKGLHEDALITFNWTLGYWECDLVKVRDAAITSDVVEFMVRRLHKLPEATQKVLKLAACIGNQFDLATLAIICETPPEDVAADLWSALREGLMLPQSQAYKFFQRWEKDEDREEGIVVQYRFLHDRVQQAAYALVPQDQKASRHLSIGRLLSQEISMDRWEEKIFDFIDHLNLGRSLIQETQEKSQLVRFNLIAGQRAKATTAYQAALSYFTIGIELLPPQSWQVEYDLTLKFYQGAAEVSYLSHENEKQQYFFENVLQYAHNILDCIKVYQVEIERLISQNQQNESIKLALKILNDLEINLPNQPTPQLIEQALDNTLELLGDRGLDTFADLAPMTHKKSFAALQIMASIMPALGQAAPAYFLLVACEQLRLCIQYGHSPLSQCAYGDFAATLSLVKQDIDLAYQFVELTLREIEKTPNNNANSSALFKVASFTFHRKCSLEKSENLLLAGYQSGIESGDLAHAGYSLMQLSQHAYLSGENLQTLEEKLTDCSHGIAQIKQANSLNWHHILVQAVNVLCLGKETVDDFIGRGFDEIENTDDRLMTFYLHSHLLILTYLMGDIDQAIHHSSKTKIFVDSALGFFNEIVFYFYSLLAYIANNGDLEQDDWIIPYEKLQLWAVSAPMNCQHKLDLVDAEKYRVWGQKLQALEFYDRAIAGAKENKYIQEEALANELAAKFYLDWGKEKFAALYLQEAYYCYAQWGAKAKVQDLEVGYPQLLKPILQRARQSLSSKSSISKLTSNSHSQTATVANISSIFDFSSLLKASQTLSGEIELDRLLSTLMQIILENAGATKGALLLTSEQGLTVEAMASRTGESSQLTIDSLNQSIPLEDSQDLPVGLINYVRRTTETALLDAKAAQEQFPADSYLLRFHPQSLLCMPLQERGKLIGILYLENRLTADVFTSNRIEILDTLCAQAAISLENARLYQQAQQALKNLQEAQLQLVQSEKMATLGNLVAGVAHEINNPVGFIGGNIRVAQEYLQDLLTIVSLYQENTSPPDSILEEIEALDIEFIAEDFPKLMVSMQEGYERIGNISTSLRTFSRTDTAAKTEFNLHDGIDSTLLILKYRLKANENRPAIEIIKNYGDIPLVKCYAGQINQVFMNLLANAIDALEESNEGKVFEEIEKTPNCITIATELSNSDHSVIVRISDNGVGMPEEVKTKIFDQGFTTKGVGKGTGLGMAIAYQIVIEKHGGQISCDSTVGEGTIFTIMIPK